MGTCNGVALLCKHLSSHVVIFSNLFIINFILLSYVPSFLPISLCYQAMGSSVFVFQKDFSGDTDRISIKDIFSKAKAHFIEHGVAIPREEVAWGFCLWQILLLGLETPIFICYVFGAVTTASPPCLSEPVRITPCWKISHQYLSETHWG